jgi:polysaccharide pyruvyl transferase WcaK-like protein
MTTITSEIYPKVTDYEEKEEFIALNCAFDRSHLRYGENIGQICTDIAKVAKELSKIAPVKYYSHMHTDENILPFLQCYGVPFEVVRLYQTHPREIIRAYAKPSLVIGMRGHAQMIPFGCQTPIVSIVSHNKIQWFLEDIGKPEWGVDVLDTSFQENLFSKTKNVLNNKKEIQNEIRRIQQQLMNTTMENVEIATRAFGF